MKKILAFGASNSKASINKKFAYSTADQLDNAHVIKVDLNDFTSPLYSIDLEREIGVHDSAMDFDALIRASDAIVVSLAEHNGLHTAAFKNLWDWLSRIPREKPMNIWGGKPMYLLSTSTSKKNESNVHFVSEKLFPFFGADIVASFHLPSFNHYFKNDSIVVPSYSDAFKIELQKFQNFLDAL